MGLSLWSNRSSFGHRSNRCRWPWLLPDIHLPLEPQAWCSLSTRLVRVQDRPLMATTNSSIPLPNPFTPLAFLPPVNADQLQIATYLCMLSTGVSVNALSFLGFWLNWLPCVKVYIWDWLCSISEEIRMYRMGWTGLPRIAYFFSRSVIRVICRVILNHSQIGCIGVLLE